MDKAPSAMPDIEQAILDYLRRHPNAMDTERGIREWWLDDMRQQCSASNVQHAIGALVAAGALLERVLPDGQHAYASPRAYGVPPHGPH